MKQALKKAKREAPHQVLVECWSGPKKIDRELAPLVEAWNGSGWLIVAECCTGHGRDAFTISVLVRLDRLPRFVATVRMLDVFMRNVGAAVRLDVELNPGTPASVWTEAWGCFRIMAYESKFLPCSPAQIADLVECGSKMMIYEPLCLEKLAKLPRSLRRAMKAA